MTGMLNPYYFSDQRKRDFATLMASFSAIHPVLKTPLDLKMELLRESLWIDKSIFDRIYAKDKTLGVYFLPWSSRSRRVECKAQLTYLFPVEDKSVITERRGQNDTEAEEYVLDDKLMGNFWFHKLYTERMDYESFDNLQKFGGMIFKYDLPAPRNRLDDGQLKMCVDAVLAVDALEKKNDLKILVLGSSSPGVSGLAYDLIGEMVTNSVIELYDPVTVDAVYVRGTNKYIHKKQAYEYTRDLSEYDLLLDDVWIESKVHSDFDPDGFAYTARNYSIKNFIFDDVGKRVYNQVFSTPHGHERRVVSRMPYCFYRCHEFLGACAACVELKYLLRNKYSKEFYERFLAYHAVNCVTRQKRFLGTVKDVDRDFYEWKNPQEDYMSAASTVPWDTGVVHNNDVPINEGLLLNVVIRLSSFMYVTDMLMNTASDIIVSDGDKVYRLRRDDIQDKVSFGDKVKNVYQFRELTMSNSRGKNSDFERKYLFSYLSADVRDDVDYNILHLELFGVWKNKAVIVKGGRDKVFEFDAWLRHKYKECLGFKKIAH